MAETNSNRRVSITRLILVPGLVTLGVTILRLVGELQHWSKTLFNPAPGGGGGLVGIVWLAPIFGIYFAWQLSEEGQGPSSNGKAILTTVIALLVLAAGSFLAISSQFRSVGKLVAGVLLIGAAAWIPLQGWPALGKTLLAYGYLARVPVLIVMFFALRGSWGTHYDGLPPNFPEMGFWSKYFVLAFLPQMVFWVTLTVVSGSLLGSIVAAVLHRGKTAPQTAS